jgi:hypothetical protein
VAEDKDLPDDDSGGALELDWDKGPASLRQRGSGGQKPASPPSLGSVPIIQGRPLEAPPSIHTPRPGSLSPLARPSAPTARRSNESFVSSIVRAFAVPFIGKGVVWLPLLLAVLIGGRYVPRYGGLLNLAFVGMLANYFAKALAVGFDDDGRGLPPPRINNFRAEFVYPGIAFLVLAIALFALPFYQAYRMTDGVGDDGPEKGQIVLFLILLLLPFFYMPIGLAVAAAGDNVFRIFNPIEVAAAAVRAGLGYFAVIGVGFAVMFVPTLFAMKLGLAGGALTSRAVFLGGLAYTLAVQGYLIGCLARMRDGFLPDLRR